ncbi:rod shape-determining protein MreC [Terracidiphilus gabretensis]|uniref:rod shape-determining protein MreC n=1 Tax=Terracidiphilus gabretensis TaxID=1577687 RepID=UPI00071B1B5E|nr:rod shape-determining protein MreC [Terracidiphilus gabretensis]
MESFFFRYRNLIVLLVLLVAQILGLAMQVRRTAEGSNTYDPTDSKSVQLIRLWANAIVSPPERAVQNSKSGAGWIWQNYFDLRNVRQQNEDLRAQVDQLRLEQAEMLEDVRQGQRLQGLNKFEEKYLYKTLTAQVIGGSGSDLSRVFYLDKGKDEGIARDMAVITPEGIVGKVREVYPHSAQVLAINDQSSGAGVILEQTRVRGILRGNAEGQPAIVNILADSRIKPGEKVLSGGGDQIFPRGLPVGVVDRVEKDPDRDGFIQVVVKPAANLNGLDEVLVITDSEPRFNDKQLKDLAQSESEKKADAAALNEQKKASEILEEKLPGLTDPNAPKPAQDGAQTGTGGASGTAPAAPPAPKLLAPQHADRFTPGYTGSTAGQTGSQTGDGANSAPRPTAPKTAQPGTQPTIQTGTNPAPKPAQPGTKPGTTTKPAQRPTTTPAQQAPTQPKTDRLDDTGSKPDTPKQPSNPN